MILNYLGVNSLVKYFGGRVFNVFLVAVFIVVVSLSRGAATELDNAKNFPPDLFISADNTQDIHPRENPTIVRSRFVSVDLGLLPVPDQDFVAKPDNEIQINLNLFDGLGFTANFQKIEKNRSGSYSWYGELKNVPMSRVVLVVNNNMVFGNISKRNFSYQIRHISNGLHAIYEIDSTKFPPTSEPIIPNIKPESSLVPSGELQRDAMTQMRIHISGADNASVASSNGIQKEDMIQNNTHISGDDNTEIGGDVFVSKNSLSNTLTEYDALKQSSSSNSSSPETQADDGSTVDVLVVYTAEARAAEGGVSAMETLIDLAESETNAAYSNSGVGHVVSVVAKQEITSSEDGFTCSSGDSSCFSSFLSSAQNGSISGLHDLRNTYGADLVAVLVKGDNSLCGIAYLMNPVASSFAPFGYSVTQTSCATGNYSFGHEIGHNMSARHDRANDNTDGSPFNYNHGYVDSANNFKTIMGTSSNTRIQYFSNPNVLFNGAVTGVPEGDVLAADNRLTFQNTALTVANFRDSITETHTAFKSIVKFPNSQRVVSPYWQSDSDSYTFIAVTHTSLSGMASQIGIVVRAIKNNGTLFGSAQSFTIDRAATEKVFIVRSGHASINSSTIPDAKLITGNSIYQHGFVHINPIATDPATSTGTTLADGYRDPTMLSFWGSVVTESNTAGFAMEFIGDMGDSQATNTLVNNAQVVGPAAP